MSGQRVRTGLLCAAVSLVVLLGGAVPAAHAVLERVGPNNNAPSVGGYPAWYQDTTGLALEFCDPKNQAEVDGGWCLLLPGDVPVVPEVFPTSFFDEHFWFAADAGMTTANGGKALLVLATEAAFAAAVEPGGHIAFSRIRIKLTGVPVPGAYRFIHPYGEELITCPDDCRAGGTVIFFSDDVGVEHPFDGALQSRLGPFLLPSNTPGGAELPAVTGPVPGKLYIADPTRSGPVTGSRLPDFVACPSSAPCDLATGGIARNHNIFRIEGPARSNLGGPGIDFIETVDFALMGRVFQGPIAGKVTVDRASYERVVGGGNKVDVFATAFPSTQGRLPGGPAPAVVTPQLVYFDGPCFDPITGDAALAGLTSNQMFFAGSSYWGQSAPAVIPASPAEVCVVQINALATNNQFTSAFFPAPLGDRVVITAASYDPVAQTLSVSASSSDQVALPAPTLTVSGFGVLGATGELSVTGVSAPPAKVHVLSSRGGSNELQVSTGGGGAGAGTPVPIAFNDTATVAEDSEATPIAVLTNDTVSGGAIPDGATLALVAAPLLGTAVVNGTAINYTPNLNASGTDIFTYTVTVAGVVSNQAAVTVAIARVNDAPTAVNDLASTVVGVLTPINVLANDTDPDGPADIVAVVNLTQPAAGASVALVGNVVNFTATVAGTYHFTYQAQDAQGVASANLAEVTVTVAARETITVSNAEFRTSSRRLRVAGTVSPASGQRLELRWANGTDTVSVVDTPIPDAVGNWFTEIKGATGIQDPTNSGATQLVVTSPAGSSSGPVTINIRN